METTRLGRTELRVTRTSFGALPIQRTVREEAVQILRRAIDAGITFFDTARAYTDSEAKLGEALAGRRTTVVVATKTSATTREALLRDLETSLRELRTDYVDLLQLHNPQALPDPEDPHSSYAGLVQARRQGKTRFVGVTTHAFSRALEAIRSGAYDTVQFPLSVLSDNREWTIVAECQRHDVGLIAMKPLAGGLIRDLRSAFALLWKNPSVVTIWGVQRMSELEQILALDADPPALDVMTALAIERERVELSGAFCRACGYCLPCPAEIPIPMAARMPLLLRRMPWQQFLTADWRARMDRIRRCTRCGDCQKRCPYGLDAPELLRVALEDYERFAAERSIVRRFVSDANDACRRASD